MEYQPVVSIIVPVYKTEKYLRQCVESVLAQSYYNWELILVDDGSPDKCAEICDKYAARDFRIKAVHTPNQGLSCARNTGVANSSGEFITFLDSDDLIHPEFLTLLMKYSPSYKLICADFAYYEGGFYPITAVHNIKFYKDLKITEYIGREFLQKILYQKISGCNHSACGKIFHKSILIKPFTPGISYEDLDIFYQIISPEMRIIRIPLPLYLYRQHPESYIHVFNSKRSDVLDVTDRMKRYFSSDGAYPDGELYQAARDRRLSAHFNILGLMSANNYRDPLLEERCWRGIKLERRQSLFNPEVRFQNKAAILITYIGGKALYKAISKLFYRSR